MLLAIFVFFAAGLDVVGAQVGVCDAVDGVLAVVECGGSQIGGVIVVCSVGEGVGLLVGIQKWAGGVAILIWDGVAGEVLGAVAVPVAVGGQQRVVALAGVLGRIPT